MTAPTSYETMVDGVPCFGAPTPHEQVDVRLMFAVGAADETFRELGVLHLLEHLAAGAAREAVIDFDATVELETTAFEASGPPEQVAWYLELVCSALADPPADRLPVEARVVTVEAASLCHPIPAGLFAARHGAQHAGLSLLDGPGPDRISAEQVRDVAARWFTRSNAVLHVLGDLPPDVRLPLWDGPVPRHRRADVRAADHAVAVSGPVPGAGVLLRLRDGEAALRSFALVNLVLDAMEEAGRHRLGESYRSGVEDVAADRTHRDVALYVDARGAAVRPVAGAVLGELQRLRTEGPSHAEMTRLSAVLDQQRTVPYARSMRAATSLLRELSGLEAPAVLDPARPAPEISADALRDDLDAALRGGIVYVHEDAEDVVDPATFAVEPICVSADVAVVGRTLRPPLLARALDRDARRARLVVGDDGLAEVHEDGEHVVHWSDVVGVECGRDDDAAFTVFSRTGCEITLDDDVFPGSEAAVDRLRSAVDPTLFFDRSALRED